MSLGKETVVDGMVQPIACPRPRGGRGFTYIALLILIAVMSVALAVVSDVWHLAMKREREQELLFIGDQFRQALVMYGGNAAGLTGRYPQSLADLLKDPRFPMTRRYLRKVYADPMTDSTHWGLVKSASGEIVGVYSQSEDEPVKQSNFSVADQAFEGKKKYSEWVFMVPSLGSPSPGGVQPTAPGQPSLMNSRTVQPRVGP